MAENNSGSRGVFANIGVRGLEQYGGRINEEWLRRLQGERAARYYREMADNDDAVGAILYAIEMLLRNVEWRVEPFSEDPVHEDQAEFTESLMNDMESTWEDMIAEALSMLPYGYAPFEICYKRRIGPLEKDPTRRSIHTDGLIGWRDLAIRAQTTIDRWEFDDEGNVTGFWQHPPYGSIEMGSGQPVFIPIRKALVFRTTSRRGNPEGRSVLRNAFVSYYRKKRIAESEAIGIERDLAGMPIFYVQPELFNSEDPDASAQLATYRNAVENIKKDEQYGLVLPSSYDEDGNQLVKFELAGTGSRRTLDTDKVLKRYEVAIARTVLADFIMLGHQGTGSFALSSDKTHLFSTALGAFLKALAAPFNRQALPRLYELNGWNPSETAQLVPGDIEKEDVEQFTTAIVNLTGAGWLTPGGAEDESHLRGLLDMPDKVETESGDTGAGNRPPPPPNDPGSQEGDT